MPADTRLEQHPSTYSDHRLALGRKLSEFTENS